MNHKFGIFAVAGAILLSFSALAPTAVAHECTVEEGEPMQSSCEAECKEGEYHDHTVNHEHDPWLEDPYNHVHYHCESTESGDPAPPPEECEYNDIELPKVVCNVLDVTSEVPDPAALAGYALGVAGGAVGSVNPGNFCPQIATPDPDHWEIKPGEPPEVDC